MKRKSRKRRVLILVENLSVPFDRRVWQESLALRDAGYDVVVVCPKMIDRKSFEVIDGIEIHRYLLPILSTKTIGYLWEYPWAFIRTLMLAIKIFIRKPFHIIHGCNPPDFFFAIALLFKPLGVRFVYDQHDLCPETFESRFNIGDGFLYRGLRILEQLTYFSADKVLATNDSYRKIALARGRKKQDEVVVVRSAPDLRRFSLVEPKASLKCNKKYLVCYLGTMGPQDGVENLIEVADLLVNTRKKKDIQFTLVGGGDMLDELRKMSKRKGLSEWVHFTGRIPNDKLLESLSTADLCVAPDPQSPLNSVSTMNKILEYMALERAIVSFDLVESRYSAGKAAVYAENNDISDFADKIQWLLERPEERKKMGKYGRSRLEKKLSWENSKENLIAAYNSLLPPTLAE